MDFLRRFATVYFLEVHAMMPNTLELKVMSHVIGDQMVAYLYKVVCIVV